MLIQCDAKLSCAKCKESKDKEEFYKTKQNKRGYGSYCRQCHCIVSNQSPNRKQNANTYYIRRKAANPELFMWKQAKHRAQWDYNNMEFTITVEDIKIPEKCPYFNKEFIPLDKEWGFSLDRIDSSKGYTPDNIQVISYKANKAKNDLTATELVEFAKGVLAVHQGGLAPC
jgi:hypothetical protein